jgi:DNA-binding response OmpR family regulator
MLNEFIQNKLVYNILLVEDNRDIQKLNKETLERHGGYEVRLAMNLTEARKQIAEQVPSLIILDIMLPDGSGLEFLQELRHSTNVPVLLLTALGESSDIVKGLKAGGDDYLAKPYNNDVFLARIESLLRRSAQIPKNLTKGSLTLDIISGRAFMDDRDLLLTQKEFAVLLLLTQNEEKIINAEAIYRNVWKQRTSDGSPTTEIDTNTLQATISNIRKKIEPSGFAITVSRGHGYTFVSNK